MTDSGFLVLQIIGGITFIIASIYICLKVAEDHIWVIWLLLATVALWIVSLFISSIPHSYSTLAFALIILVFAVGWFIFFIQTLISVSEWLWENRKTVLITLSTILFSSAVIYFVISYGLYSEFFLLLLGLMLISAVIGKPPAVREFVITLTKIAFGVILTGLIIFISGAFIHMSYNWGFSIFLEFGSERFWLAWDQYILFSQLVFGILIIGAFALFMLPGIRLPTPYERMVIRDQERNAATDDLEAKRRRHFESGGKSW